MTGGDDEEPKLKVNSSLRLHSLGEFHGLQALVSNETKEK